MTHDCCVFNFLRRSVDGKRFHSETSVVKFPRRTVEEEVESRFRRVRSHSMMSQ